MFGRTLPWPGECPDGGFVDLNFAMADLGFTGRFCCVEGVSATKVLFFVGRQWLKNQQKRTKPL